MNTTIKLSLLTTVLLSTNLNAEEKLEDIVVTSATKTSQKLSNVTSNIHVITAEEIEERHYTTVVEALNSLPGISFRSNGALGKVTAISLRGMDSNKALILIDGVRYNDVTSTSGAAFSDLMASDIERIEVIKGAQSGIWGADASAGVINIITKSAKKGLKFSASQEFGSFNTSTSNLNASYKNDDLYLQVSHQNLDTDSFTAYAPYGTDVNQPEADGYNNKTTNLKAGINITTNDTLSLSHTIIDAKNDLDDFNGQSTTSKNTTDNTFSTIAFNHVDSFNELNLYAKKSIFHRSSITSVGTTTFDGEIKEYGINSKIPYLKNSFVLIGADYKDFKHQNLIDNGYKNKALFITNNNIIESTYGKTIISESLRKDDYNTFNDKTTGKIGLKHTFNIEGLSTSTNYGTAYNVPTPYHLYEPAGNFGAVGNPDLQPEEIESYDVGITYKDISFTYFHSNIDNLFEFTTGFNNSAGVSKIRGYEVAYSTTFNDEIATNISYSKLKAQDTTGQTLARRPAESLKFSIDYYGIEKLHLGLNGEYVGERYNSLGETGDQTGKYTVANFTANYEVDEHMKLYTKVDNITNKYYQTVYDFATSPRAIYAGMKLTY